MKLLDYISQSPCEEVVVHDTDYDVELYFYSNGDAPDLWDDAVNRIAAELEVTDVEDEGIVTVALSELISSRMEQLRFIDLFNSYDIDDIMDDIMNIFAGFTSAAWMCNFADALTGE